MKIKLAAEKYLNALGQNGINGYQWEYKLVDSKVNAWCMPGG
jgi:hypothetical protein